MRLETGSVELYLSNRVKNSDSVRLFCRATVEVNLSLGQLIRNVFFEEAEPEFQQFAFFKTRIGEQPVSALLQNKNLKNVE